jgi:hypothetical protein
MAGVKRSSLLSLAATAAAFGVLTAVAPTVVIATGQQLPPLPPEVAEPARPAGPPRYELTPDPGHPLAGITRVRPTLAFSAPEADACLVDAAAIEPVMRETLTGAGLSLIAGESLTAAQAAAVPEVFVSVTVLRDESGVCAASLWVQLGLDTDVVLLHRNLDTPQNSLKLSNGYVELARTAQLSVGVPPTFGEQLKAAVREQITRITDQIRAAGGETRR